jgi:hypothetical protein
LCGVHVPVPRRRSWERFSPRRDLGSLYAKHFTDPVQERRLLSTAGFLGAFATARAITHAIRDGKGPFGNISPGGHHIHHMTFGICGMLGTGYLWVNEVGTGANPRRRRASRITSTLFGAGAALTLDEFALWLNLKDDYWSKEGRESIDAVVVYGGLLSLALISRRALADLGSSALLDRRARGRARRQRVLRQRAHQALAALAQPGRLEQLAR